MIDGKGVLTVIPARGGSKGLPGKNLRPLAGLPLVAWPIRAALGSQYTDKVIVSTDDPAIAAAAKLAGAEVPFMRPSELATDTASSMAVIRHALESLASAGEYFDYVIMLEPTSPLTESGDVDAALELLNSARAYADAIVGICKVEAAHPEYDVRKNALGLIAPYIAPDFKSLRRRQEIEKLYFLEGSLYISAIPEFKDKGSFYHDRTLGYEMPREKSLEIDELVDFICIEAIIHYRESAGSI